jgi:hypothetical protein
LEHAHLSSATIRTGEPIDIEIGFYAQLPGRIRECAVLIYSTRGLRVAIIDTRESGITPFSYGAGYFSLAAEVEALPLIEGEFTVGLYLVTENFAGNLYELGEFAVTAGRSAQPFAAYSPEVRGLVALRATTSFVAGRAAAMA